MSRERSLGAFSRSHHFGEAISIENRQLGQHFAVELDVGFFQVSGETRVGSPVDAGGGVDAGNPEATEIAFATAAIAIGVAQGFHHLLVRGAEVAGVRSPEAFGQL